MSGFSRSEDKEPHSVFTTTNNDTQQERVDASEQRGLCCSYCCKWGAKATCSKCKFTTYCSTECQVADWKEGNHKHECKQSRHVASGNLEYMEQFREGLAVLAISNENNVNWGNSLLDDVCEGYVHVCVFLCCDFSHPRARTDSVLTPQPPISLI